MTLLASSPEDHYKRGMVDLHGMHCLRISGTSVWFARTPLTKLLRQRRTVIKVVWQRNPSGCMMTTIHGELTAPSWLYIESVSI